MYAQIGECFEHIETLDKDTISAFANSIGDLNPLHHDDTLAEASRYGGIIACGPHYASILIAQTATYFSRSTSMVGLEFSFKFKAAVRPGETLRFHWEVIEVNWNEKLNGDIVTLSGFISNSEGKELLTSSGKVLVTEKL